MDAAAPGTEGFTVRMLLQTNSYIVPKDKRVEHARLVRRFRQTLARLGCDHFEVYEQVGANWGSGESTGRYVHIMRFRDRKHQLAVQAAERNDAPAQALITEFCELINFPYQQQQGLFAVGFYQGVLPAPSARSTARQESEAASDANAAHEVDQSQDANIPLEVEEAASSVKNNDEASGDIDAGDTVEVDETAPQTVTDDDSLGDDDEPSSGEPSQRQNA